MPVTIPEPLVKGVLGNAHARALLDLLASRADPVRYAKAREALGLHPEAFQRALSRLESFGLVQLRAPEAETGKRAVVLLEPTARGRRLADAWQRLQREVAAEARPPRGKARRFRVSGLLRTGRAWAPFALEVAAADAMDACDRALATLATGRGVPRSRVLVDDVALLPGARKHTPSRPKRP